MTTENKPELVHVEPAELDTFTLSNERSVINLLPRVVAEKVLAAKAKDPDYFNRPEHELKRYLMQMNAKPNRTDDLLRAKFWVEYNRAMALGLKHMVMAYITQGVCDQFYFHKRYLEMSSRVGWLLCPPANLVACLDEMLTNFYASFSEVAREDDREKDGSLNLPLIKTKIQLYKEIDARRNGMHVQKIDQTIHQKSLNVNVTATKEIMTKTEYESVEAIERKMRELDLKEKRARNIVDVSSSEQSASQLAMTERE